MKKIVLFLVASTVLVYLSAEMLIENEITSGCENLSQNNEDYDSHENNLLLPATCFAPGTDQAVIDAFYENRIAILNSLGISEESSQRFNLASRWSATATDGGGLGQGDFTTLTWSYVPDGTPIGNGGCGLPDQGTFSSDFIAFFNGIYGPPTTPGDFTTAPWHTVFVNMFNSWSNASGIVFVYEPNDDGATVVTGGSGVVGTRGDFRISGHRLDGTNGVLACNYFPQNGDMIIDTSDNFYASNPGIGTTNVLTHEIGHGLGIQHVCPVQQTKLMEPFVTTAFLGPQEDDILATNRHYGDPDGVNNTPGTAVLLGANPLPTSYARLQRSIDDNSETDYFSFTINAAAILTADLDPTGTTYLEGVQNGNGSCSAGTNFNAATISDLMFEILSTDGTTVLATANANGPGISENVSGLNLPAAGTYFMRVSQQGTPVDNVQMYDISIGLSLGVPNDPPTAVCTNYTAALDATGNVTITGANIDNGSSDPEGGPLTFSVSPSSFTCADIGDNTVTLTVTDDTGQTDTCTATVTVEDTMMPTANCQDFTAQLDATGNVTITAGDIDSGSVDNCSIASLTVSPSAFTCADIGTNTVTLTVTDSEGNVGTCNATVTVEDTMMPTAICQDFTTQLDAAGNATITAVDIDNGSTDNCGVASIAVSPNSFTCADIGANTVTLTVTDVNGNVSSCTSTVTVEDTIVPIAACQNFTAQLDATGNVTITGADVDNGSSDNCGIASLVVSPSSFTCGDIGDNIVTLTVTDVDGNVDTCTTTVTVEDAFLPTPVCQDLTVQIDASGTASIVAADIDNGSTDNCGIASLDVSPSLFTCADLGANTVTLTVTDTSGNVATCSATVTVEDNTVTTAICRNITAVLDENGSVVINPADVDDGPADLCNVASATVTPNTFTCADIGPNMVTLTKIDLDGNEFTCTAVVNIVDGLSPTAMCQDITVQIDASCEVTIDAADIDNGSTDNCEIASIEVFPDTFTCNNVGDNTVTLTVTDETGNVSTCTAIVTVEQILGIGETVTNLSTVSIYPNPAQEEIYIANPESLKLTQLIIHDILGRVIAVHDLSTLTSNTSFNVSNLQSGNYIVIIKNNERQTVKRFVKK